MSVAIRPSVAVRLPVNVRMSVAIPSSVVVRLPVNVRMSVAVRLSIALRLAADSGHQRLHIPLKTLSRRLFILLPHSQQKLVMPAGSGSESQHFLQRSAGF